MAFHSRGNLCCCPQAVKLATGEHVTFISTRNQIAASVINKFTKRKMATDYTRSANSWEQLKHVIVYKQKILD